ncbi:MAG TPA: TIGR03000 domain-containing protein [Gemmataceae bacterium]|jgi:uncharacterized protein (TIGR03000 family)
MFLQRKPTILLLYGALLTGALALTAGAAWAVPPPPVGERAEIVVNVPPDATVWVDGARMRSVGLTRVFVTPPLVPGYNYGYDLRISWLEGGRARGMERHVSFRAGDRLVLDVAQPNRVEPAPALPPEPPPITPWRRDYLDREPLIAPNYPLPLVPVSVLVPR